MVSWKCFIFLRFTTVITALSSYKFLFGGLLIILFSWTFVFNVNDNSYIQEYEQEKKQNQKQSLRVVAFEGLAAGDSGPVF